MLERIIRKLCRVFVGATVILFFMVAMGALTEMPGITQTQAVVTQKSEVGTSLGDIFKLLFGEEDALFTEETETEEYVEYYFRSKKNLTQHFEKHGDEFDGLYKTEEEYEKGASDVVNNKKALHKLEAEDGDDVYYLEDTNEFVIVSKDGYIRTYFKPSAGKKYYDRQ